MNELLETILDNCRKFTKEGNVANYITSGEILVPEEYARYVNALKVLSKELKLSIF